MRKILPEGRQLQGLCRTLSSDNRLHGPTDRFLTLNFVFRFVGIIFVLDLLLGWLLLLLPLLFLHLKCGGSLDEATTA